MTIQQLNHFKLYNTASIVQQKGVYQHIKTMNVQPLDTNKCTSVDCDAPLTKRQRKLN